MVRERVHFAPSENVFVNRVRKSDYRDPQDHQERYLSADTPSRAENTHQRSRGKHNQGCNNIADYYKDHRRSDCKDLVLVRIRGDRSLGLNRPYALSYRLRAAAVAKPASLREGLSALVAIHVITCMIVSERTNLNLSIWARRSIRKRNS